MYCVSRKSVMKSVTMYWILVIFCLSVKAEILLVERNNEIDEDGPSKFNPNFLFGASTSAYQIEGGWNADGKMPSIWDTLTHDHPELIADKSNADVGPNSYHFFDKDLELIKELGLKVYRFSISWARVLPTGDISSVNEAGIDYYNRIINKLKDNGVEPMVTMYHYDLPEELQKLGGLANPLFISYFREYAHLLFTRFGDRVKWWITFNEPFDYCVGGYGTRSIAPLIYANGIGDYLCVDHTIKAHALAYRLYREKFFDDFHGKIGISLSSRFYFSKRNNEDDVERGMQYALGWIAKPIFSKTGGYPDIMVNEIGNNSKSEGRKWSRLPIMSNKWKHLIRGSADFFGLNYYTSRYIEASGTPIGPNPSWERDSSMKYSLDPSWKRAKSSWLYSAPEGLQGLLRWIKKEYNNIEVFITENGWSDDGQLDDSDRIVYIKDHLRAVLRAMYEDGCNVSGYTHWSLFDNFEWLKGYTERFGLYYLNITSPYKERVPKQSAAFYKQIIRTKIVPN